MESINRFEPDLQVQVKGYETGYADKLGVVIRDIVLAFCNSDSPLDLRRMHRIIITSDFAGELANLSSETASGNEIIFTDEEYATAVAQVLAFPKGDDCEICPVLNGNFLASLVQENKSGYESDDFRYWLHVLHHEFSHVHDDNKKMDAFKEIYLKHHYKGKDMVLYPLAEVCWSEYFANYMSSATVTDNNIKDTITNFSDALDRTKVEVDGEILSYRYHGDTKHLMSTFGRHGEFLAKAAAYVLGFIDGLDSSLEDLSSEVASKLSGSYFEPVWGKMHIALKGLHSEYPGWRDLSAYNELVDALDDYYARMGLILSTTESGGLYVDVPFRDGTTPPPI